MTARSLALAATLACAGATANAGPTVADVTVVCTPAGVGTFPNRVHVRCSQSFSGIALFAAETADAAAAARYMSMATSALIAGRNLRVSYDPADQTGTKIGCETKDCRLLKGLEIY